MECRNCHSKWDAGPGVSKIYTKCPFCGESLTDADGGRPGVYDNSRDALAYIMCMHGADALLGGELKNFFLEYAPGATTLQKNLVFSVYPSGAAEILKSNMSADERERWNAYRQAVKAIRDTYGTERGLAESVLLEFAEALGWKLVGQRNFRFGPYAWRVLDIRDGKVLLLAEDIVERRAYHGEYRFITWEKCALRGYLNGEFLQNFSSVEQSRIATAKNRNPKNQWYGTGGGSITEDRVFLLSIGEAVQYFGDSGQLGRHPAGKCCIDDRYNSGRMARDGSGEAAWWWLRSPGGNNGRAAGIDSDGSILMHGDCVDYIGGGIRPALWLKL